ncbi:MAG: DUF488 domain-containing protein, partial [Conexivisphaera sp.]
MIKVKRIYDAREPDDGPWILVERLWPRGIRRGAVDIWMRDIAPSPELRRWFSHDPSKWEEFVSRYRGELAGNPALRDLVEMARRGNLTLVYSARDREHNSAVALRMFVE